ncbi:CAP-Gly domain-containing linker protein 4 [Aphanomyces cochlioides]|nr:CAP-Gly domain-containing linker protein 4 [Aphanomyces cochlioides]
MTPTDYDAILDFVAKSRPSALTLGERLDILRLQALFRREKLPNPSGHIAKILGRGIKTVQSVWSDYLAQQDMLVALPPANRKNHSSHIPNTKQVMQQVLEFVRIRRLNQERVVAKDVLSMLADRGHVSFNPHNEKDASADLRATQAYLLKHGFKRGAQSGSYGLSKDIIVKRDRYVHFIAKSIIDVPKRTIVYLDESFIHHHYSRHNDSIYHPNDDKSLARKPKHKGRRLCFIAGIVEDGPENSCLVGLEMFEGGRKQPKDYHGMFTHDFFVAWLNLYWTS